MFIAVVAGVSFVDEIHVTSLLRCLVNKEACAVHVKFEGLHDNFIGVHFYDGDMSPGSKRPMGFVFFHCCSALNLVH